MKHAEKRRLIAGNWKMNGLRADGLALARAIRDGAAGVSAELVICPPATLLAPVGEALAGSAIALGGQDCHPGRLGAHTGDIAATMLADLGCRYVIVGHSERRSDHREKDLLVREKATTAQEARLTAIICLGETKAQRDRGLTLEVVTSQLWGSWPPHSTPANAVVAYEPVWAIGTGRTPSNADIVAVHGHLRRELANTYTAGASIRLIYGGSVKPSNAREILALPGVDGALVGGASLKAEDFLAIARACPP